MIKVGWPTLRKDVAANVWRVLDLSGLTRSVRDSRNYTRAGYLYINGARVTSLKHTIPLGTKFRIELRFPNGRVQGLDVMLVPANRIAQRSQRQASPGTNQSVNDPSKTNYRG